MPKSVPDQRAHAYFCHAGYWTIGFGRLCKPDHPSITEAEAVVYLAAEIQSSFKTSLRSHPYWPTKPDNRLSAIVDFTLSLGAGRLQISTLRKRINQQDRLSLYAAAFAKAYNCSPKGAEDFNRVIRHDICQMIKADR